jgi:CBS domain-containing protein
MQARDVMTTVVVTARPETTVAEMAQMMIKRGISGLPVVDGENHVLGMVSEGDLLRRAELGTERRRSRWLDFFTANADLAADYVKSHARSAADVMVSPAITVAPDATLSQVVDVMEQNSIKRVPVTENGKLLGIVSRGNLMQALGAMHTGPHDAMALDRSIRDQVLAEFRRQDWGLAGESNVVVINGVVHLWGTLASPEEQKALRVAAEGIPGVRRVADHTILFSDDLHLRSMPIL